MPAVDNIQTCTVDISANWTGVAKNLLSQPNPLSIDSGTVNVMLSSFKVGTAAGQVDTIVSTVRSIPSSGTDTITLSTMAATGTPNTIKDTLNQAAAYARIRALIIQLLTTGDPVGPLDPTPTLAASITVGNAASHVWDKILNTISATTPPTVPSTMTINNGGTFGFIDRSSTGLVVASGSDDKLLITNNDGALAAVYRIVILGCSA